MKAGYLLIILISFSYKIKAAGIIHYDASFVTFSDGYGITHTIEPYQVAQTAFYGAAMLNNMMHTIILEVICPVGLIHINFDVTSGKIRSYAHWSSYNKK